MYLIIPFYFPAGWLLLHSSGNIFGATEYYFRSPEWLKNSKQRNFKAMNELFQNSQSLCKCFFRAHHNSLAIHLQVLYCSWKSSSDSWFLWNIYQTLWPSGHLLTPKLLCLAWKFNKGKQKKLVLYSKDTTLQVEKVRKHQKDQHLNCQPVNRHPISPYI